MATLKVTLKNGLTIGENVHVDAVLREPTAGDVIDAMEDAEKLVMVPNGTRQEPQLVTSPTLVGAHILRRQIVSIGDYKGPLSLQELKRLTPHDMDLLQSSAETMDAAVATELAKRGRDDSGPA